MFKRTESFFTGSQKTRLFYQVWEPDLSRGHLVITHGQAEHSGCYQRLVEGLKSLSYTIYAWDLRGHGRSEGQRGYALNFTEYLQDFQAFLKHLQNDQGLKTEDLTLLGHSMGGLIQLRTILEVPHWSFKAQVLSSPMLGVALEVPIYKDFAALLLRGLMPSLTLSNEIRYEDLTRDPEVLAEYKKDFLRHDRISAGVYLGAVASIEMLRHEIRKIKIPTLWQIPSDDPVVGSQTSQQLFNKLGSQQKVLKVYPDRRHEIYNDLGREEAFKDLSSFLEKTSV